MEQTQSSETTHEQQAAAFFRSSCCESCATTLIAKGYNRPDTIPTLQEKNLVKYGIEDGHLAKMVRAIEKLKLDSGKDGASDTSQPAASSNASSSSPATSINSSPQNPTLAEYDVMLSYCWTNQLDVLRISDALKARGFSVWIDVDYMTSSVYGSMHHAVSSSKVIIPCLSPAYVNSANCERELSYAADKKKRIVPIRLQNGSFDWADLITAGKLYIFIDFSNISSSKFEAKMNDLEKEIGPPSAPNFEAMRKALEFGILPVRKMKIVLVGQGRAGKTSLLRALRNKQFQEDEISTVYVNPVEVDNHILENWKDARSIAQLLKSAGASPIRESASNQSSPKIPKLLRLFPTRTSNNDLASLNYQKYPMSRSESKNIVKRLEDMHLSSSKAKFTTKDDLKSTTLTIYDFAGQSRYSVFQQIFITAQAIYLVVFRLDAMFPNDSNEPDQSELRVILSWLNTIHLRSPKSKIFLIGTQCDKSTLNDLSQLESFIPNTIKQLIIPNVQSETESLIFVTSAKTKMGVKELKDAIDKSVQLSISEFGEKPVDWIRFQDKIAELISDKKTKFTYTIEEMMKIANEFRITDRRELEAVLRYFHNIGVVLYFPRNTQLRRVVFPDPQAVVNVISEVFRYHDTPPTIRDVSSHNLQALEELKANKVWMRSLLDELWGKHLDSRDVMALFDLLKEFDLLCDIKPLIPDLSTSNISHNTLSVMPCLLPDEQIKAEDLVRPNTTIVDLVLCFPDNVLPNGLYHQLVVRFAANPPRGYIPRVYQQYALVALPTNELVIREEFVYGIIRIQLILQTESIRTDFAQAYAIVSAIVAGVISEHWSKRWVYKIVPACPRSITQSHQVPHGVRNIPFYGQRLRNLVICCDHSSHNGVESEVDCGFLKQFWFDASDSPWNGNTISSNAAEAQGIEDGVGTIMISYSWGNKDPTTGEYSNQEQAKRIAKALESRGFKIWIDIRYMKGNMVEKMIQVIRNCDAVVACVSNEYHVPTSNANREFLFAWHGKKKIFGVKMARDVDMSAGAYGFYKGLGDKFYNVGECGSEREFGVVVDELVRDISSTLDL